MYNSLTRKQLFSHDHGEFRELRDSNVLVYLPHGFGDWSFFSCILPLLEPSNKYYMTRFGDDSVSVMDGCSLARPLYLGSNSTHCDDGGAFGISHFDIIYDYIRGTDVSMRLPLSLYDACERYSISAMLYTTFPETHGSEAYPYHTKARGLLRQISRAELLDPEVLSYPLRSAISFDVPDIVQQWVESRLINFMGIGSRKLCVIARSGYTAANKNWGNLWRDEDPANVLPLGHECREFMRLMLNKDPNWAFLTMEDRVWSGNRTLNSPDLHCAGYAQLFGNPDSNGFPFGIIAKAIMNVADLHVGVPAGSHHLAMLKPGLPCIGIWIDHFPSWYDEPKAESIHVISRNVVDQGYMDRPGSFCSEGDLNYDCRFVDTKRILGQQVMDVVEELI